MAKPLSRKASSASGTRPQATLSNSRVPRKTTTSQIPPSATKTVAVGTRPKDVNAAKKSQPLPNSQARVASSHGAKDADTLALLERIALQQAEIDKLNKKIQVTKPVEKKMQEIPRPKSITKLQSDMGLADNRRLYSHCRAIVRDVIACAGLLHLDWRYQDIAAIAKVAEVARSKSNQLQLYHGNWATLEIMKTFIKNKRSYQKRLGSANQADEDMMMDGEALEGNNDDEAISDNGTIDETGEGGDIDDIDGDIDAGGSGGNAYDDDARNTDDEGNNDDEAGGPQGLHDDIYEDENHDYTAKSLGPMEGGDGEGDANKQGNGNKRRNEDHDGDQLPANKTMAAKKREVVDQPVAASKERGPAGTKRKVRDDEGHADYQVVAATGARRNAGPTGKKMRLDSK